MRLGGYRKKMRNIKNQCIQKEVGIAPIKERWQTKFPN